MAVVRAAVGCALVLAGLLLGASGAGASAPITFVWPTSVALQADGSLVVVENGLLRVVRVQPTTGHVSEIASGLTKPIAVVTTPSGSLLVSDGHSLERIDGHGRLTLAAKVNEDIGPLAVGKKGDVFFTTDTQVFRLAHGAARPVPIGRVNGAHGIAIAGDGAVLVSDTANNRVRRIDPRTGVTTTLIRAGNPRGLDVARDGTIYVVEATSRRIVRFTTAGKRLGTFGPTFHDPHAVAVAADGDVYVVDTSESGQIRHIDRNGSTSTLTRR